MQSWFLVLLFAIISAGFCCYLASEKGYPALTWLFLGFLFSIVALLTLIGLPNKATPQKIEGDSQKASSPNWTCPKCKHSNPANSFKCSSCSYSLT